MIAMILAAGRGERMLPITKNIPKPLIKFNNQFLIEYAIKSLIAAGINEIVINVHHLKEQIKATLKDGSQWGIKIIYSEESELLDTGGGILQAIKSNLIGDTPFIIMGSDIITDFDMHKLLAKTQTLNSEQHVLNPNLNALSNEPSLKNTPLSSINNPKIHPILAHLILVPNPYYKPQGDFSLKNNNYLRMPFKHDPKHLITENSLNLTRNNYNFTYASIGIFHPIFFANITERIFPLSKIINKHLQKEQITAEVYNGIWQNVSNLQDLPNATVQNLINN